VGSADLRLLRGQGRAFALADTRKAEHRPTEFRIGVITAFHRTSQTER